MSTPDWNDSQRLTEFSEENIMTAGEYQKARQAWASAKRALDFLLVKGYKDEAINRKASYEKAILMIVEHYTGTPQEAEVNGYYKSFIEEEANYKGLEEILKAKQSKISLCQSLIKNQIRNT